MRGTLKGTLKWFTGMLALLLAAVPLALADNGQMPPPGTLNYVEGQVLVQGQEQTPKSVGSTYVGRDQEISTQDGNAEMLLTPGVYLRLGHHSEVKMLSPDLADTKVQLTEGSAMVEVDELFKQNNLDVVVDNSTTHILKNGLYDFIAYPEAVRVLDGKAVTTEGDSHLALKKGHQALLIEGQAPIQKKFDKSDVENDPLYRWSMLRSEYATESNVNAGNALMSYGGWWGPGWYWDPFWADFAFMPGFGFGWGPFGYPFFSPWMVGLAPYYGFYGYGGANLYHYPVAGRALAGKSLPPLAHVPRAGSAGFRTLPHSMSSGRTMAGGMAGGFHGGGFGGFHGGGFGGFHGGGFGGGHR